MLAVLWLGVAVVHLDSGTHSLLNIGDNLLGGPS